MKKIRRLPTILGIILILVSIGLGVIAVRRGFSWFLRAEPEYTPKEVKITNITEGGFTVSWITDAQTTGFIKYGPGKEFSYIANDDRDQGSETGEYYTHYVSLKNLEPSSSYSFKIGSGDKLYDNNGQPYQATTGPAISSPPPASDVAYGSILKADGSPASGAIVYFSLANATPQSAVSKSSGGWVIPLNLARTSNLGTFATYDQEASIEDIFVQAGNEGTSTVVAVTARDNPLPAITLGQNFDFRNPLAEDEEASQEPTAPAGNSKFNIKDEDLSSPEDESLTIINPDQGETITTDKPAILGTAPAGKTLEITVESDPQTGTVSVDENGEWEWSPPEGLEPGNHTVTVSYADETGLLHSITRRFTVLAAEGEGSPAIEASPSATPTVSRSTPTPTLIPSLTTTPTATPTATSSGRISQPSTESGVPQSGNFTPTFLFLIFGLALIISGWMSQQFLAKKTH